jgi:DNA-binding NarL/FixJ family response regulator
MTSPVKVLLVDDHRMFRTGLRALVETEPGLTVVGEAADGRAAIEMVKNLAPDVVVMDLRMPELNGIDATRMVLAARPQTKVIALSASADERSTTEMLRAGASGYLVKVAAYEELIGAIKAVVNDRVCFKPSVVARIVNEANENGVGFSAGGGRSADTVFGVLSLREREVLQLIAEGKATKEVAAALRVSVKTVETHRRNLMGKLHLDSVAELTKYAIREGLTSV